MKALIHKRHRNERNQVEFQNKSAVHKVRRSGTPARAALAILNYIMHGVGIFIKYTNTKLKEEEDIAGVDL